MNIIDISLLYYKDLFCFNCFIFIHADADVNNDCEPRQYLELGRKGTIKCSFDIGFHAIHWYDSVDTVQGKPIVSCISAEQSSGGCDNGMYAVAVDGSLLIENIVLAHERTFAVLIFNSEFEEPMTYYVDVITTGKNNFTCITFLLYFTSTHHKNR